VVGGEQKKSVAGQFAGKYKSETYFWTQKLNRDDCGVHKYWVPLAVVNFKLRVNTVGH